MRVLHRPQDPSTLVTWKHNPKNALFYGNQTDVVPFSGAGRRCRVGCQGVGRTRWLACGTLGGMNPPAALNDPRSSAALCATAAPNLPATCPPHHADAELAAQVQGAPKAINHGGTRFPRDLQPSASATPSSSSAGLGIRFRVLHHAAVQLHKLGRLGVQVHLLELVLRACTQLGARACQQLLHPTCHACSGRPTTFWSSRGEGQGWTANRGRARRTRLLERDPAALRVRAHGGAPELQLRHGGYGPPGAARKVQALG